VCSSELIVLLAALASVPFLMFCKSSFSTTQYSALILGLRYLVNSDMKEEINSLKVFGDSKLVIEQIKGSYKVKSKTLLPLYEEAKALIGEFPTAELFHIPRELNARADELSNIAMDSKPFEYDSKPSETTPKGSKCGNLSTKTKAELINLVQSLLIENEDLSKKLMSEAGSAELVEKLKADL
jgi:ribonuclease HI